MLNTKSEQSRLLNEVPDIVAEEIELEAEPEEFSDYAKEWNDQLESPIPKKISKMPTCDLGASEPVSAQKLDSGMDSAGAVTILFFFKWNSPPENGDIPLVPL